jgi:transposase
MPFPKLEINRQAATWSQILERALVASAKERPKIHAIADLFADLDKEMSRERFAWAFSIGARQLRRWIHRFNEGGIDGLLKRRHGKRGRKPKIPFEKFNNELSPMIQKLRAEDGNLTGRKVWQQVRAMPGCDISYPALMQLFKRRGIKFRRQPTVDIWSMPNLK